MSRFLNTVFEKVSEQLTDIKTINISSVDGFSIHSYSKYDGEISEEQLAAVSSSISSLSNSVAKQLIKSSLVSTTIETDNGYMFLVNTEFLKKQCIICIITGNKENLAKVRYFATKLSNKLKKVEL